jgi:hypothetical protein
MNQLSKFGATGNWTDESVAEICSYREQLQLQLIGNWTGLD